jgi:hypothetical protein
MARTMQEVVNSFAAYFSQHQATIQPSNDGLKIQYSGQSPITIRRAQATPTHTSTRLR